MLVGVPRVNMVRRKTGKWREETERKRGQLSFILDQLITRRSVKGPEEIARMAQAQYRKESTGKRMAPSKSLG